LFAYGGTVFAIVAFSVSYALVVFAPGPLSSYKFVFNYAAIWVGLVWNALGSILAAYIHERAKAKYELGLPDEIDDLEISHYVRFQKPRLYGASLSHFGVSAPIEEFRARADEKSENLEKPEIIERADSHSEDIRELFEELPLRLFSGGFDQRRYFSVTLAGDAIEKDCIVYVNCSLNLDPPNHPAVATAPAQVDSSIPAISFTCSVDGFECVSASSLQVGLTPEHDTKPVVFMLRVLEADTHRITISAYQNGVIRGQVVVDHPERLLAARPPRFQNIGFGSVPGNDAVLAGASDFQTMRLSPSVSLDFLGPNVNVVGNSPHDCLDWNAKDLGPWRENALEVMSGVRDHIAGLYSTPPAPEEIDREFAVLGTRIAAVLPEKLVNALKGTALSFASIQVPRTFDFPIDLCWVDGEHLQDKVATARWFTNTRAIQLNHTHRVSNIALVLGKMKETSQVEQTALAYLKPAAFAKIDTRKDLIDRVFKTSNFEFLHYFGHCGRGELSGPNAGRFLSLANDTRTFRLSDLGLLDDEKQFFRSAPFVVLNCCDGTDASDLFDGNDSFPHRFIDNASVAFVGALWPIDSRAANRFVSAFYERLRNSAFVAQALHETRRHMLAEARKPETVARDKLFLTLAARSYVYYGPPDLRCVFKQGAVSP